MKRIPISRTNNISPQVNFILAVVLLMTSVGLAMPLPALASPTPAPSGNPTALPAPGPAPTPTPDGRAVKSLPASAPVPLARPDRTGLAAAIGAGAEMGQRSARVMRSSTGSQGSGIKTLTPESLTTEGTWSPTFGVAGLDVSSHQPTVDWQQQWNMGARFAYVKATEGNYYPTEMDNPVYKQTFDAQYAGARNVGMIRGAYHFAIPNWSSGADQARYFVQNGGGWSADGYTLPPVLDFEFNPYAGRTISGFYFGDTCYGMSAVNLASWVREFGNTMLSLTGRLPVIYTNTSWWNQCLGNVSGLGNYPLWVANYPDGPTNNAGPIPAGWSGFSLWQYSSTGPFAGDSNVWNGDYASLQRFASGFTVNPLGSIGMTWTALGGGNGKLGYPVTSEICGLVNGGCYQGFQNGTIHYAPGVGAYATWGGIRATWGALGYENGKLGYPVTNEICGLANGGCYQGFQGGTIHYAPGVGAHATWGGIRTSWGALGYENGKLGYPVTNEICGLANGGCYQGFQGGTIHYAPGIGAYATWGGIRATWGALGYENGKLGYPVTNEICGLANGGCYQGFQGGTIHYAPGIGAYATWGGIRATWGALGYENGKLGYPVTNEICGLVNGGCYQGFQNGTIHYAPGIGAYATSGPIRATWGTLGYEKGKLGYPVTNEICGLVNGGCYQGFQNGTIHYAPGIGAYATSGPIRATWGTLGYEKGKLGYPTGVEVCGLVNGGCSQDFQGGAIHYAPGIGAHATWGGIRTTWGTLGYENGKLGYPVTNEICGLVNGGCYQGYQNGTIHYAPGIGAYATSGPIRATWGTLGYENGKLGYPVTNEISGLPNGGISQRFQHGGITWSPTDGSVVLP
ncbi:lysozyme M1 [Arthrobacter sp. UKPF54-2]|uniref:GH25 family lysozyme n=1 Tax=Arthrobacter sp. UKPF54-2 TaxID=2600159 RepID=UPI0011B12C92|nr:GH25 family lysozyme [Arthrobacter sp. UKPF54-2]QDY90648.1 lysozyme M1 [Arthrobacter sp. UKPF54-2]